MTIEPGDANAVRTAILEEARKLAVDALYSEKGHFAAAGWWRLVNYWLGVPAALAGAFAGASIIGNADKPLLPGLVALLSATLTALNTFLNPSDRASQHHRAGVDYGRLRRTIRQFVQVEGSLRSEPAGLRATLTDLTEKVGAIQADALPIPSFARSTAYKQIQSGSATYTADELDVAGGPGLPTS